MNFSKMFLCIALATPLFDNAMELRTIANNSDSHNPLMCLAQIAYPLAIKQGQNQQLDNLISLKANIDRDHCEKFSTDWELIASPLFEAARYGTAEDVKKLLDAGADIDQRTSNGFTPLMAAAAFGNKEVAQFLILSGANRHLKNEGTTAYDFALEHDKLFSPLYETSLAMRKAAEEYLKYEEFQAELERMQAQIDEYYHQTSDPTNLQFDEKYIALHNTWTEHLNKWAVSHTACKKKSQKHQNLSESNKQETQKVTHDWADQLNKIMEEYDRSVFENSPRSSKSILDQEDLAIGLKMLDLLAEGAQNDFYPLYCAPNEDREKCKEKEAPRKTKELAEFVKSHYSTLLRHFFQDVPNSKTIAYTPDFFDDWYRDECQKDASGTIDNRTCMRDTEQK